MVSVFALRNASACALPRPSAIASAKLAKSTVNQSQRVICSSKPTPAPCVMLRMSRIVVRTLPTSTTNITGFPIILIGFSLRNASRIARWMILGSQMEIVLCFAIIFLSESVPRAVASVAPSVLNQATLSTHRSTDSLKHLPRIHQQVLDNRPQTQRREEGQRADNQD